ncbi:MAG: hypothetical protein JJU36_05395 [Phycisphaeraceae bacterium]|nr:hypothetical protein [Phycisphaeraceae bacterium]
MARPVGTIPLWFRLTYTGFVIVLIPFYAAGHGLANFLWFSNIALLSTVLTIWFRWPLLASMQLVSVGVLELIWTIDFTAGLLRGGDSLIGLAQYMFDEQINLHLRLLSLYHLFIPWVLFWLAWRLGYDRRAWWAQALLAWMILLICYFSTNPDDNINWTFGLGEQPQDMLPSWLYLMLIMIAYPVLVYLPTHLLVQKVMRWLR